MTARVIPLTTMIQQLMAQGLLHKKIVKQARKLILQRQRT